MSSRLIPHGNGYFWASPGAIKSPVGASTAVPQEEVMLPSPSWHKHPKQRKPKSIFKQQPRGQQCQKPTPGKTPKPAAALWGEQTAFASPKQH